MNAPFLRPTGCPVGVHPALWRAAVEQRIEEHHAAILALLAALDQMDGDENLEPDGDAEATNEDGGDIQDEPHDGELDLFEGDRREDAEHSLGWSIAHEDEGQGAGALYAGYASGDLER